MAPIIWFFVKFFKEEKYADAFIRGDLRLNRLSYFRDMEAKEQSDDDDGRPDKHEAISHWWQPHDIKIRLSAPGFDEIIIGKEDLAAPVSVSYDYHANLNVLCLYAVRSVGFDLVEGQANYSAEKQDEIHQKLAVDERNFKFGEFAVIAHAPSLLTHLKKSCRRGACSSGALW